MPRPDRKRVLIRTQPLGHNYGGLLQAYALQVAIRRLGHGVDTDRSLIHPYADQTPIPALKLKAHEFYYAIRPLIWPRPLLRDEAKYLSNADLRAFAQARISTVKLLSLGGRIKRRFLGRYSAFVVGSDQVWRPLYSHIPSSLFNFLPHDFRGRRISYAASFGTSDAAEYSTDLRERTRPLAQRLDAISVREPSGIALAKEVWGMDRASCHVDPTMLLDRSDYDELVATAAIADEVPTMVSYVLDATPAKASIVRMIEELSGLSNSPITRPLPDLPTFVADPDEYRKPSVESWLRSIRDAQFVITDSFHGCVFAILFNTPFAVVPNAERGVDRISSLLGMFELKSRLLDPSADPADTERAVAALFTSEIQWAGVTDRLNQERDRAHAFLKENL